MICRLFKLPALQLHKKSRQRAVFLQPFPKMCYKLEGRYQPNKHSNSKRKRSEKEYFALPYAISRHAFECRMSCTTIKNKMFVKTSMHEQFLNLGCSAGRRSYSLDNQYQKQNSRLRETYSIKVHKHHFSNT